jgi:two-component system response regulator
MIPFTEILVAEDNDSDAELVLESLDPSYRGRVRIARDGVEALEYLGNASAAAALKLVVLDVKLPRVDGLAVLREMKARPELRTIPVVMLTSSNIAKDVELAYSLGANSYVQKPVRFDDFRAVIAAIGHYWIEVNEPFPRPRQK